MSTNSGGFTDLDPLSLKELEKTKKLKPQSAFDGYLKRIYKLLVGIFVFFFIIVNNVNKLNTLKSTSLELQKKTKMEYEMNEDTLPVHFFLELDKLEITNRMACLKNKDWEACMYLCD